MRIFIIIFLVIMSLAALALLGYLVFDIVQSKKTGKSFFTDDKKGDD